MRSFQPENDPLYPCPCCGYVVMETRGVGQECQLCAWTDSIEQLKDPFLVCAPNGISLWQAQRNFFQSGVSQEVRREFCRPVQSEDCQKPEWRPVINKLDDFGTEDERARLSVEHYFELYYWEETFWNFRPANLKESFDVAISRAHCYSIFNRNILKRSSICGCFYCGATFKFESINEWTDGNLTAICPMCSIDAVLGSAAGYPVTAEFLLAMKNLWFR